MLLALKEIFLVFYSASFYRRLVARGRGIGLFFLFIASLLGVLSAESRATFFLLRDEFHLLFESLPDVAIEKGTLSMTDPSPQVFSLFEKQEGGPYRIVFDLTAKAEPFDVLIRRMQDEKAIVFVLADRVVFRNPSDGTINEESFDGAREGTFTHQDWINGERLFVRILGFGYAFFFFLSLLVGNLVTAMFGGAFLFVIAPLFGVSYALKAFLRIAAAAKIPGAFLSLALSPPLAATGLIWFGFASFGLLAAKGAKA